MKKRLFAAFVSLCLIVSMLPTMAFAEAGVQDSGIVTGASGLCEHHTQHTADCGYTEGTAEIPCSHEHTEDCYTLVTECVHEHTAECYPAESVSENTATPSEPEEAEPTACTHKCSEESGCITKTLDCKHEHKVNGGEADREGGLGRDEACGYVPATEGTPCTFVCEVCNAQDSGDPATPSDAQPEECTCETLCTEEEINADCPVCSAEGAELDKVCVGVAPVPVRSGSAHTHPVCGSSGSCTDPDHGTEHTDVTWTEWNETTSLPDSGGNYCLTKDVTLSETWKAPSEETSLCLNGHSITFTAGLQNWDMSSQNIDYISRSVIKVPNGARLTVTDCQQNTGTITGGTGTFVKGLYVNNSEGGYCGGGIFVDNGGTLNLYGGSIKENHCPMYKDASGDQGGGGGIFVNGGDFHMYGGTITQNSAHYNGNGVFCWGGDFHMYGGSITENGREISDWRLTYMGSTGGVGISNGADMTMYGGEISANLAYSLGGICVNGADSRLTLYYDAKIINHTCQKLNFGGVYIQSGAEFYMNGGQICNNTEGAVQVQDGSTMVMTDGTISAHQTYGTYGIDISDFSEGSKSKVTISGGTVSGNSSSAYDITHTNAKNSSLILSGNPSIESISLEPENVITIGDELTYSTPITVRKDGGGVFTSGWTKKMQGNEPENYFASWSEDYSLSLSENELNLGTGDTEHIHNGITFDKDLGVDADDYYMGYPGITESGNYRLTTDLVFGNNSNLYNSLFIANNVSPVTVNLCLNKYNLNRMDGGLSTGPVLVVYTNGTLNLYSDEGGTISGNSSTKGDLTDGLGGGIYIENGTLNIYGGKITGNTADVAGGGIYADKENSVNICGGDTPIIITGNNVGEKENNLYFADGATMKINVLPAEGSQIGIRMETPGQFAKVADGIAPAEVVKFFISDDPSYSVVPTEDGLALMKQQTMPTIGINYQTEMLTDFANDGSYTINGKALTPDADGTIAIQEEWMGTTVSIVRKGDGDTADSNAQNLLIPARPAAPDVTAGIRKINGADASMEYSSDNGAIWTAFTDETISRIGAGTYLVRYRAKADAFASQSTSEIHVRNSSGGGSSGGGSSSGSDSIIIDRPDKDDPTTPTTAETKTVKTDSKGSIVITKSMVADAISTAQADARKNGNTANGVAVVVPVEIDKTLDGVQITLKADALDKLVSSGVKRFTIDTDRMADFGFTLDTLKELNRQTSGDVILKVKTTAVTSQEAKAAVGNRPAYDITLWYLKDGKETPVNLNGKTVSIAIPYTPAKGESTGNLYAIYVDGSGKVEWLTKSSYDADRKAVIFEAQHFSIYGVGYQNPVPNFTDIGGHWAKEHILFTVSRGLFSGTSETTFSPDSTLTRGMFVTAFGRLAGIDPADYQNGTFTDVKADAYYAPYVNWAAKTGIVDGITSTTFAPDSNITREQMAVILKNYADKMGYPIPKTLEAVTFADNAKISSWAKDAVKAMQQAGVLSGKANNLFDPKGNATRAEAATVLHRFVEVIIDP